MKTRTKPLYKPVGGFLALPYAYPLAPQFQAHSGPFTKPFLMVAQLDNQGAWPCVTRQARPNQPEQAAPIRASRALLPCLPALGQLNFQPRMIKPNKRETMTTDTEHITDTMSDAEILAQLHTLANRISYHNAAEGAAYTRELPSLRAAQAEFYALLSVAHLRDISFSTEGKGYLL